MMSLIVDPVPARAELHRHAARHRVGAASAAGVGVVITTQRRRW
jgi:hypothetical protein